MSDLKPCPFCGSSNVKLIHVYHPQCQDCGSSQDFIAGCDAVYHWNMRSDGWISVDERLPKKTKNRQYLCKRANGDYVAAWFHHNYFSVGFKTFKDVVVWKELPPTK